MAYGKKYRTAYNDYIVALADNGGKLNVSSFCREHKIDRAGFYKFLDRIEKETKVKTESIVKQVEEARNSLNEGYNAMQAILSTTDAEDSVDPLLDRKSLANKVIDDVVEANSRYAQIIRALTGKILYKTNIMVDAAKTLKELNQSIDIVKKANDTIGAIPKTPLVAIQNNVNTQAQDGANTQVMQKDDVITIEVVD